MGGGCGLFGGKEFLSQLNDIDEDITCWSQQPRLSNRDVIEIGGRVNFGS